MDATPEWFPPLNSFLRLFPSKICEVRPCFGQHFVYVWFIARTQSADQNVQLTDGSEDGQIHCLTEDEVGAEAALEISKLTAELFTRARIWLQPFFFIAMKSWKRTKL